MLFKWLQEFPCSLSTNFCALVAWHWCWRHLKLDQVCAVSYRAWNVWHRLTGSFSCRVFGVVQTSSFCFQGPLVGRAQAKASKNLVLVGLNEDVGEMTFREGLFLQFLVTRPGGRREEPVPRPTFPASASSLVASMLKKAKLWELNFWVEAQFISFSKWLQA